ncbi:MAG: VOC family protein [Faecalibacillus sp.]
MIKGIHHISLNCINDKEYEKTLYFYNKILGLKIMRKWNNERSVMLDSGNGYIEILNNATVSLSQGTIRHFAFSVDNVDKYINQVRKEGYQITVEPKDVILDTLKARVGFCIGPVGEEIEFFQEK